MLALTSKNNISILDKAADYKNQTRSATLGGAAKKLLGGVGVRGWGGGGGVGGLTGLRTADLALGSSDRHLAVRFTWKISSS